MHCLKTFTVLLILIASMMACHRQAWLFTSFREPATEGLRLAYSTDGYQWTDLDTTLLKPNLDDKVLRDPSIVQGPDGTFHLVFTSAWKGSKTFGYASSKDLVHWSSQRAIPVMEHEPATVNVWAPELFYDDEQEQFLIIWASTIPHRFAKGREDENNNHRMYVTTTKDFQVFSPTRLFLDPGFSVIDCQIVKRATKNYVLILKDNTRPERNIKAAFAQDPLGPYTPPSAAFTPNFTEGPAVAKVGQNYLVYYDQYRDKIYGARKTKDFLFFTDATNDVSLPEGHKHGTIIKVKRNVVHNLKKMAGKK